LNGEFNSWWHSSKIQTGRGVSKVYDQQQNKECTPRSGENWFLKWNLHPHVTAKIVICERLKCSGIVNGCGKDCNFKIKLLMLPSDLKNVQVWVKGKHSSTHKLRSNTELPKGRLDPFVRNETLTSHRNRDQPADTMVGHFTGMLPG
jgi:hypothetical protein